MLQPWEDHHSPPIHILFNLCKHVDDFLGCNLIIRIYNKEKISNVVSIHCLAGKGRTGTAICCYLMYCGRFDTAEDVLIYYAKKRFLKGGGVT
jgi:phosphatidylinositol-3,4,5-trisphosphate 3-phosphatase/dual-specificity protein phosphatase PTEN